MATMRGQWQRTPCGIVTSVLAASSLALMAIWDDVDDDLLYAALALAALGLLLLAKVTRESRALALGLGLVLLLPFAYAAYLFFTPSD
jgi:4-amino-4-deoxy-L-arabinose transferase-like glycosyltransferase